MRYNNIDKNSSFKNPEIKSKINKDLSCNSKIVVYIIECNKYKEVYIGSTQALNRRKSLRKRNVKIPEEIKHLYECSHGNLKPCL